MTAISKALAIAMLVAGCDIASGLGLTRAETDAEPKAAVAQDLGERVNYTVNITGVDGELLDLMQRSSLLQQLIDRPPPTLGGILRRAETDQGRFDQVLRSRGYYEGKVNFNLDTDRDPVTVTFSVEPGEPFVLADYNVRYVDPGDAPATPDLEALNLEIGMRAEAARIVAAGNLLIAGLHNEARPFAREVDHQAVVDFEHRTMSVDVLIDAGPRAGFGPVTFTGLGRTKEDYVGQWVNWKPGDPFRQSDLDALQRNLGSTGLFTAVAVTGANELDKEGNVPISVEAVPAKHRSVGASIGYSTDRGAEGRLFWEHRNLLGRDEDLRLALSGDFLEQAASIHFTRPNFRELDRALFARTDFRRSDTDAFKGLQGSVAAGLEWRLTERWRASIGGGLEYANLDDNLQDERITSVLGSMPATINYHNVDSELDPTSGFRLDLLLTPFFGRSNDKLVAFHATEVEVAGYYPVDRDRRFVLAGRTRIGSIAGAGLADIPPNRRLYSGGGGSIRGYAFQTVGPLDAAEDPIGGRSKVEVDAEVRVRVWREIAVVPFITGGQVYDSAYPDFSDSFQWAAGLGLRYHTVAGPLRLDAAFPLNPREGIDDSFQIYISLGQAF